VRILIGTSTISLFNATKIQVLSQYGVSVPDLEQEILLDKLLNPVLFLKIFSALFVTRVT
jgi:hypothetical protein